MYNINQYSDQTRMEVEKIAEEVGERIVEKITSFYHIINTANILDEIKLCIY